MGLMRRVITAAFVVGVAGCGTSGTQLAGAGSSFVYPFFSKVFYDYNKQHGDVTVNYQSIGSGAGIEQFTSKTVDFGASDVPMNSEELNKAGGPGAVIQIPVALGGVSVVYNVPGLRALKLSREVLASIFLGNISKWNDSKIAALNAGTKLPDMPIIVVHRSDGSGTSYIFTDFLSHVSSDWKSKVGTGKSVRWPAPSSIGGKGNEGVAGQVRNSRGTIGYVELAYAIESKMDAVQLQNKSGKWVADSQETVKSAAAAKPNVNANDFSIVDSSCANCYPIAGYSWAMIYKNMSDKGKAKALHDALAYVVSDQGQKIAGGLDYVPLPSNVESAATKALDAMTL